MDKAGKEQGGVDLDEAEVVLAPMFDATRDYFASREVEPGVLLERLIRVRFVVDPELHDSARHFAACHEDGSLLRFAPELQHLPPSTIEAIMAHEFGHAVDFLYPASWETVRNGPARWRPDDGTALRVANRRRRRWSERSPDQVEWDADSIAMALVGRRIGYCGPCLLQCWGAAGRPRPKGLR